jgi:hypothetical protein
MNSTFLAFSKYAFEAIPGRAIFFFHLGAHYQFK